MEWLIILFTFGITAFLVVSRILDRIDRADAERDEGAQ